MKTELSRQVFEKYWNTNFYENTSSGSRVVRCRRRQTDMTKLRVAFRNFANAPKKSWSNVTELKHVYISCYVPISWMDTALSFLWRGGTKNLVLSFMLTVLYNDPLWTKIKLTLRSFKVDFQSKLHPRGLNMHTGWYNSLQLCPYVYILPRVLRTFWWQLCRTTSGRLLPAMTDPLRVMQRNCMPYVTEIWTTMPTNCSTN